jgi:hypothetical protein
MDTSSRASGDEAIAELYETRIWPMRDPSLGRAGDSAEVMLRLVEDRDRVAEAVNDTVIRRIVAAGLALETAMGLLDGNGRVAGKIQDALGELDLAIRDFRNVLFDHHQPDSPNGGQPS